MIDRAVTDLPHPLSPTTPSVSPLCDGERHILDGAQQPLFEVVVRRQVADLEERAHAKGSTMSRNPSPRKLNASTVTRMKAAGNSIQG